jgi:hypothetical protein
MTYEILKTLNFHTIKDKHSKVHDYVIKNLLGLHFQRLMQDP